MSLSSQNETIFPEYFGQDYSLYGCYHLTADYSHSPAMLICQPIGHEYERSHRAMRQLALQSAKKGLSAMRFDYYATGDSAGDGEELNLSRIRLDIQQAIRHWRDKTGVEHVTLLGLRLGATLAAQLASSCSEIDSLVLYAPVFDGEKLMAEWQQDQDKFIAKHSHSLEQIGTGEVLGFPLTEKFQRELSQQFHPEIPVSSLKRVLTLLDEADVDSALLNEWMETYKRHGVDVAVEVVENIAFWRREAMEAIVPIKTIRHIIKWIMEGQDV